MGGSLGRASDDAASRAEVEIAAAGLLTGAREYLREGWCQGADATDLLGQPVHPWSEQACHWSLLGAIVAALDGPRAVPAGQLPLPALAVAMAALADLIYEPSLVAWNDDPGRLQTTLLDMLDRASALCLARAQSTNAPAHLQ